MKFSIPLSGYFIAAIVLAQLTGCIGLHLEKARENYTRIPVSSKSLDIPKYKDPSRFSGMPYTFWHYSKQKEKQLNLVSPETSSSELIFRLWITNPYGKKAQPHGLLQLKCDSGNCEGQLIYMLVDFDVKTLTETITDLKRTSVTPKNLSWTELVDSLYLLKFHELPTDESIPGYYDERGGTGYANNMMTFLFEYATPDTYRFYQYNDLNRKIDEFWQPAHVVKILNLFEREFQVDKKAREYFDK